VVGKLAPDSYFFIDRKPGTYTFKVEPPFDFTYFEADVQIAASGTYYYSINSRATAVGLSGGGFVTINPTPTTGTFREQGEGLAINANPAQQICCRDHASQATPP
jgi:hypothetical protein